MHRVYGRVLSFYNRSRSRLAFALTFTLDTEPVVFCCFFVFLRYFVDSMNKSRVVSFFLISFLSFLFFCCSFRYSHPFSRRARASLADAGKTFCSPTCWENKELIQSNVCVTASLRTSWTRIPDRRSPILGPDFRKHHSANLRSPPFADLWSHAACSRSFNPLTKLNLASLNVKQR